MTNSIILVIAVAKISLSVGLIRSRTTFNFLHLQEVNFRKKHTYVGEELNIVVENRKIKTIGWREPIQHLDLSSFCFRNEGEIKFNYAFLSIPLITVATWTAGRSSR